MERIMRLLEKIREGQEIQELTGVGGGFTEYEHKPYEKPAVSISIPEKHAAELLGLVDANEITYHQKTYSQHHQVQGETKRRVIRVERNISEANRKFFGLIYENRHLLNYEH